MDPTLLVRHIDCLLTMDPAVGDGPLGVLHDAAVAFAGDSVAWIGPDRAAPSAPRTVDARGCVVMPGLVDCHTHAVWAGSRASEFRERLTGVPYSEILERGGGILSTVRATRDASAAQLVDACAARLAAMRARGTTTVEVKSGYGLEVATEVRLLQAARAGARRAGVRVKTTFLGAHAIPPEHRADRAAYVHEVIEHQLPAAAPHADFIDAYIDRGAFTLDEGQRILAAGRSHGLGVRVHAEQVDHTGAAAMAARLGARSADHLEQLDAAGVQAMAASGTVAVLLPGAMLYLGDPPPPVGALREAGVPMAIATDLNPGSSPVADLWTCATLACVTMKTTVEEALRGITAVAADALGAPDRGRLRVGGPADCVVVEPPAGEAPAPEALVQFLGGARPRAVFVGGQDAANGA